MADCQEVGARYDITIAQGATFTKTFTFTAGITDLTGYDARLFAKRRTPDTDYLFDLEVGDGLAMTTTTITATLTAAETAALNFDIGTYILKITSPGGVVTRVAYGSVVFSRE